MSGIISVLYMHVHVHTCVVDNCVYAYMSALYALKLCTRNSCMQDRACLIVNVSTAIVLHSSTIGPA
jgi:hypothetical protein